MERSEPWVRGGKDAKPRWRAAEASRLPRAKKHKPLYPGFRFAPPWALCFRQLRWLVECLRSHHSRQQLTCAVLQQSLPQFCPELFSLLQTAGDTISNNSTPLRIRHQPIEPDALFAHHRMRRNRQLATASQAAKEGAFSSASDSGEFVIEFADCSNRCFVVYAGFNPKRACPTAGSISVAVAPRLSDSPTPDGVVGACQNQRVILAFIQLAQASVHITGFPSSDRHEGTSTVPAVAGSRCQWRAFR